MNKSCLIIFLLFYISVFSQDRPSPDYVGMYTLCSKIYLEWSMPDNSQEFGYRINHKSVTDTSWYYLLTIDSITNKVIIQDTEKEFLEQTYSIYEDLCLGVSAFYSDTESQISETCTMGIADVWPEPPYLWSIESVRDTIILKWQSGSAGCDDTLSHYEVFRSFQDSSWLLISTVPLEQTIFYDFPCESGEYCYYVTLVTYHRKLKSWDNICINITSVQDEYDLNKDKYTIFQSKNYPNPFNPSTTIEYSIPKSSNVEVSVYNLAGQKIATLISKNHILGNYQVSWDGSEYASGVYIYQIKADNFVQSKKMLLLK